MAESVAKRSKLTVGIVDGVRTTRRATRSRRGGMNGSRSLDRQACKRVCDR